MIDRYNSFKRTLEKYEPSLFVVSSPLQVMCAVEAMRDYEINDYFLYAVMGRTPRDSQTKQVLEYFKVKYTEVDKYQDIYPYKKRLKCLLSQENRFHRAFVGGYCSLHHYFLAMQSISDHSTIVTLDDGVESVTLLEGGDLPRPVNKLSFINNIVLWIAKKKRHIELRKKLYTIYSDIPNNKFEIYPNTLGHICDHLSGNSSKGVYFAGTTHRSFYMQMGITEKDYFDFLRYTLKWICEKYPSEKKTFIPHGTDSDTRINEMCEEFNFEYKKPKHNIEMLICNQSFQPRTIVAFTSSCLLNLKRMFPKVECINVVMAVNGNIRSDYKVITDYYEKNGILTVRYGFPQKCFM